MTQAYAILCEICESPMQRVFYDYDCTGLLGLDSTEYSVILRNHEMYKCIQDGCEDLNVLQPFIPDIHQLARKVIQLIFSHHDPSNALPVSGARFLRKFAAHEMMEAHKERDVEKEKLRISIAFNNAELRWSDAHFSS